MKGKERNRNLRKQHNNKTRKYNKIPWDYF